MGGNVEEFEENPFKKYCVVDKNIGISDLKIDTWKSHIEKSLHRFYLNQHYRDSMDKTKKLESKLNKYLKTKSAKMDLKKI